MKEIQYVMKSIRNHSTILSQPCLQLRTFVTFHRYYQKEFIPMYCIGKFLRFRFVCKISVEKVELQMS